MGLPGKVQLWMSFDNHKNATTRMLPSHVMEIFRVARDTDTLLVLQNLMLTVRSKNDSGITCTLRMLSNHLLVAQRGGSTWYELLREQSHQIPA